MRNLRSLSKLSIQLVVLWVCTSAFAQQVPIGPGLVQQGPLSNSPKESQKDEKDRKSDSAAGAPVDANTYKVGPSDILMVKVWNEEKFTGQVSVQQNGKITIPLVGDIDAGNTTPRDIEAAVTKALSKYVVKPIVTVTVMSVESKKYYLDGMANHPGEYPLTVPTTVLEAVSKAAALQDFANPKRIYILRGNQKIAFNYKEVIHGKRMEQNIQLEPGDHVVVP